MLPGADHDRPLPLACVFSVEGTKLTRPEKTLFAASQPFGFILFARNCEHPEQVRDLTDDLRATLGWDCPVMIDQEGGRVARLKSSHWPTWKSAKYYGDELGRGNREDRRRFETDMTMMARTLLDIGVDVDCLPVLDILTPKTHDVIGDRAYGDNPDIVTAAGDIVCRAMINAGVTPVMKHIPGHGRAGVDSHHHLPVVDASLTDLEKTDFAPFKALAAKPYAPAIWGMVAHVIYTAIDPDRPASLSPKVISEVIRGHIGFDGLLFTDDLDMKALDSYGSVDQRARESLQAGCDLALYCHGKLKDMEKLASTLPPLTAKGWSRWQSSIGASFAS